jgi:gamma-glutamylcyclotransferase (GGCT)/AIG2-like uncharacterized protein YtfP
VHLFLYGTLMTGEPGYEALKLAHRLKLVGRDRIPGALHDLGDYPGLVADGAGIVHGELYADPGPRLLAELDEYELYDPASPATSEFVRTRVTTLDQGVEAWVYAYNGDVAGMPMITSGDWKASK